MKFAYLLVLAPSIWAVPIPNGLVGIPEVECLQDSITIVFDLKEKFFGRIYVMGYANDSRCTSIQRGRATTSVIVRRDLCGVTNLRSANPPGVVSNVKVVISFHPQFITKVDRGFEISCFYMEVNKTVTYPVSVKPEETAPVTQFGDMPICEYKVMQKSTKNDLEKQMASVVSLGEKLYHKWTCKSSTPDLWCMIVHSCYVKDTVGNKIEIVDENGCSIDKYIMGAIEYDSNLSAEKEVNAFKFADTLAMNFQCSLRLALKNEQCTRPYCQSNRQKVKTKRDVEKKNYDEIFNIDVISKIVEVLDYPIEFYANRSLLIDHRPNNQASCVFQMEIQAIAAVASCLICINIMALVLAIIRFKITFQR